MGEALERGEGHTFSMIVAYHVFNIPSDMWEPTERGTSPLTPSTSIERTSPGKPVATSLVAL